MRLDDFFRIRWSYYRKIFSENVNKKLKKFSNKYFKIIKFEKRIINFVPTGRVGGSVV